MVKRSSKNKKEAPSLKDFIDSLPPKTHDKPESKHIIRRTPVFNAWLKSIKDPMTKARITRKIEKAQKDGHLGVVEPVGSGISEMKLDFGPGYRIYLTELNGVTYLLLSGGDKDTQQQDIEEAKKIFKKFKDSCT